MILYPPLLKRGITLTPALVLIPRWAKDDKPYHAHEAIHQEQMRRIGTFRFWWSYLTDKAFRLTVEVEAYRAQIASGANPARCACDLSSGYSLNITQQQAYVQLTTKHQ